MRCTVIMVVILAVGCSPSPTVGIVDAEGSDIDSSSPPICNNGDVEGCQAGPNCSGIGLRICEDGQWGTCEDPTCTCEPEQTQPCVTEDGHTGSQSCNGGLWSICRVPAIQVALGGDHTCARFASGLLRCWGRNDKGQLGGGHIDLVSAQEAEPVNLTGFVKSISLGAEHSCALTTGDMSYCWGYGGDGALGFGNESDIGDDEFPVTLGWTNAFTQLAAGARHSCAVGPTGAVFCWGQGDNGRLGFGSESDVGDDELPGDDVGVGLRMDQVALGYAHSCALSRHGAVRCWGRNNKGQLGYGHTDNIGDDEAPSTAGDVPLPQVALQIAAGGHHSCALLDQNAGVICWGEGADGQLGYGATDNIGDDETLAGIEPITFAQPITEIATGDAHTCALLEDGAIRCWGRNHKGQLGYGHTDNIGDNETLMSLPNIDLGGIALTITAGGDATCAILATGAIRCWGDNAHQKLGYPTPDIIGDDETPASMGDIVL